MQYKVIKYFTDLQDGGHPYKVGDAYPRKGLSVSDARIAELSGSKNKQGTPLIQKVAQEATEKKVEEVQPEKAPEVAKPKAKRNRKSNK